MSQNTIPSQISELVCTRISHDLIGNIGAISNAIELLDDDPESITDIKPILELSSKVLSARLKFFRLAFGLSNASVKDINEMKLIAKNYISTIGNRNFPIQLNLQVNTPELYKIIFLSIMSLCDCFIKGGIINVTENTTGISFEISSENPLSIQKLQIQKQLLQGKASDENLAQNAPIIYLQNLLNHSGISIKLNYNEMQAHLEIG